VQFPELPLAMVQKQAIFSLLFRKTVKKSASAQAEAEQLVF